MDRTPKTRDELARMALEKLRALPGCAGVERVAVDLDEDGDWSIAATVPGDRDAAAVNRATASVRDELCERFSLKPDT